jgi:cell division transport system permease protein
MAVFGSFSSQLVWLERASINAWQNLMRNKVLTIATILIISLILFVFNLILALGFATESVITNVGEKLDIVVEIRPGVENYTIETFANNLETRTGVKDVVYVSKTDALGRFGSKYPNVISFLDSHHLDNPLPDTLRIATEGIADNNAIIALLEEPQFGRIINQEKLTNNTEQKSRNEKILNITRFIKNTSIWLNVIFALVAALIIFNSININVHTHRNEINVMKLVGARFSFIRAGFVLEGVVFAVLALLISVGFSRLLIKYLTVNLLGIISNESLLAGMNAILIHFEDRFWLTLGVQLLAITIAGMISSYFAIELYLRKRSNAIT